MSDIKAIETYYKGYRFRSRLEARWAVFFDLEIPNDLKFVDDSIRNYYQLGGDAESSN